MWSKFDDQFYMNPKIASLGRDEQDLYTAAIIYCNGQLTDGFIPAGAVPMLMAWAKIPIEAFAQAIASHLVEVGLWEDATNGYQIHDFLDWNLSKAEVLAMKAARSEAGKRGGDKSAALRQANALARAQANALARAQAKPKQNPTPSQSQDHKESDNGSGKSKVKEKREPRPPDTDLFPLVEALSQVCSLDMALNKGMLFREAKQIKGKTTPEYIRANYGKNGAWYRQDWRGKKGEFPTPALIRQTLGSLNGNGNVPAPVYAERF